MCRSTRLLGYMWYDIFLADYSYAKLLLQLIRTPITFLYIIHAWHIVKKKFLINFKHITNNWRVWKPIPPHQQISQMFLCGMCLSTCFPISTLRKNSWMTYRLCFVLGAHQSEVITECKGVSQKQIVTSSSKGASKKQVVTSSSKGASQKQVVTSSSKGASQKKSCHI